MRLIRHLATPWCPAWRVVAAVLVALQTGSVQGGGRTTEVVNTTAVFDGVFTNDVGDVLKVICSRVVFNDRFVNNGLYISDPSTNYYSSTLIIGANGELVGGVGDVFAFAEDLIGLNPNGVHVPLSTLEFFNGPHTMTLLGTNEAGYLQLDNNATVRLTNGLVQVGVLQVGHNAVASSTLTLDGGWLVVTNGLTHIGSNGVGTLNVTNGLATFNGLAVGYNTGSLGRLTITGGSNLNFGTATIGHLAGATGSVLVSGSGSLWTNVNDLYVGNYGSANQLTITNGGGVVNSNGYVGYYASASNNAVLVSGLGSVWSNSGSLTVGKLGSYNQLIISNGAQVVSAGGTLGVGDGYSGGTVANGNTVLVSGTNSVWNSSGSLIVGEFGGGKLTITNGARVVSVGGTLGVGGDAVGQSGGNGEVLVSGPGSVWTNSSSLSVGWNASGKLTINNSGQVFSVSGLVGVGSKGDGNQVTVSDTGSVWSISGDLTVGTWGAGNSLTINNGGQVVSSNGSLGAGVNGDNNVVSVRGVGSLWSNSGTLLIGNAGYANLVEIMDGGTVMATNVLVGNYGTLFPNYLTLTGGNLYATNATADGVLELRKATLTLNSGTVIADRVTALNSESLVTFNGGTLTTRGMTVSNGLPLAVGDGVSVAALNLLAGSHAFNHGLALNTNGTLTASGNITVGAVSGNLRVEGGSALIQSGWLVAANSFVGSNGSGGNLTINGGQVINSGFGCVGYNSGASNNAVLVSGANSLWNNSGNVYVGNSGSSNQLVVSDGGRVVNASGLVGNNASAKNNAVRVSGVGSVWSNQWNVFIGYEGSGNQMVIASGGRVSDGFGIVGEEVGANSNFVLVAGAGSIWSNANDLYVGDRGSVNQLTISDGGRVVNANGYVGVGNSTNNAVVVAGPDSLWNNIGNLYVGGSGSGNQLTITNGGQVANYGGYVGCNAGANNNAVLVSGSGSLWVSTNDLYVGRYGSANQLTITNGGQVFGSNIWIGSDQGATGNTALVSGAGSRLRASIFLSVGDYQGSANKLTINNGGEAETISGFIGYGESSSNNLLTVDNGLLAFTNTSTYYKQGGFFYVGALGSGNRMIITNGGRVTDFEGWVGFNQRASNNSVWVGGAGSLWSNAATLGVGYAGTSNQLTIASGGVVLASNVLIGGKSPASSNRITVSGGSLFATNTAGGGALNVRYGTLTLNSGTVTANRLVVTNSGTGGVEFNGGTLDLGGSTVSNGMSFKIGNGADAATLFLRGGAHTFSDGLIVTNNASLTGAGSITGSVTNYGRIAPGGVTAGTLSITGGLDLRDSASVEFELWGTNTTEYDQVDISGLLVAGGWLKVTLTNNFVPTTGDVFDLFDFGSVSGGFAYTNLPTVSGHSWDLSQLYVSGEIRLLPEPATVLLLACGGAACVLRRRKRSR